jgi:hypothetical protein
MSNDIQSHTNFSQLTSLIKDGIDGRKKEFRDDLDGSFQSDDGIVCAHVGGDCLNWKY